MFNKNIHARIKIILLIIILCFIVIVGRVFYIQVFDYKKLKTKADDLWSRNLVIGANRGRILTSDNVTIADNLTTVSLVVVPNQIKDKDDVIKDLQETFSNISINVNETLGKIFDDIYKYAIGVADNTIDDKSFLPIIYELDDKEEWIKKDCWQKANPALGSIKKIDDLNAKVKRAIQSPRDLTGVLVKDFNVIENRSTAWLTFDDLNNTATFDLNTFKGSYAIGGADLSITTDLTCATILLMDQSENRFVSQMYWLPADNFDIRVKREKIPYDKWLEEGKLRLCAGNTINYSDVTAWFIEIVEVYEITPAWVYYDSYSARYWIEEMQAAGFNMIRCIQGAKTLSLPMQMLGADLKAKKINYNNNSNSKLQCF